MHIFVDESGTFAQAPFPGAWCAVAAYVVEEREFALAQKPLLAFKQSAGHQAQDEVKRKHADERVYFRFLEDLARVDGFLVSVATDSALNGGMVANQRQQAALIDDAAAAMEGKERAVAASLAAAIAALSPQLYVEIICRMQLAWRAAKLGSLHYVVKVPQALAAFRWTFDRKSTASTVFEKAHGPLLTGLAMNLSMQDPLPVIRGADYSHFRRYFRPAPDPINAGSIGSEAVWVDPALLYTEHLAFVDSMVDPGIQIADLLVSGIHGCLRGTFADNKKAAELLGALMRTVYAGEPAVLLMNFGDRAGKADITPVARDAVDRMTTAATPVFALRSRRF